MWKIELPTFHYEKIASLNGSRLLRMHKKDQQGHQINFVIYVYVFNLNFRVIRPK